MKYNIIIYTLPHPVFVLLENAFNGDKKKAEAFGDAIEKAIQEIGNTAELQMIEKKQEVKVSIKEGLLN